MKEARRPCAMCLVDAAQPRLTTMIKRQSASLLMHRLRFTMLWNNAKNSLSSATSIYIPKDPALGQRLFLCIPSITKYLKA